LIGISNPTGARSAKARRQEWEAPLHNFYTSRSESIRIGRSANPIGAERDSMQFASEQNGQDWRSRIDKRFTSLRGFAALTVMLAHYQYIGLLPSLPVFKYSGQFGLILFFFLSSFLLCHSLAYIPPACARDRANLLEPIVVL
jgi:hypothetical protein